MQRKPEEMSCARCAFRRRAEERPGSWLARLWRWHTRWCPGWKRYQQALAAADRATTVRG
ncbi:MAG: hypothetical protein Kow00109_16690 [Acidobacteriota bacterium]